MHSRELWCSGDLVAPCSAGSNPGGVASLFGWILARVGGRRDLRNSFLGVRVNCTLVLLYYCVNKFISIFRTAHAMNSVRNVL